MLRISTFQPYYQILYMLILSIQVIIFQCNSVLVILTQSTLSTYRIGKPWFPAFQNFFRSENPLNIKEVMSQNVLAMLTLLIWRIKECNLMFACWDCQYKDYETQYIQWYSCQYWRYRVWITVCILIQTIQIGKYFELLLRITWNFEILGSVKLHIGDSWGKMKTFALGHFHGETQTLGGQ